MSPSIWSAPNYAQRSEDDEEDKARLTSRTVLEMEDRIRELSRIYVGDPHDTAILISKLRWSQATKEDL